MTVIKALLKSRKTVRSPTSRPKRYKAIMTCLVTW